VKEATVGYLVQKENGNTKILLGKRSNLFHFGLWNGPGGKREAKEGVKKCLQRELREEIGVHINLKTSHHFATANFYYKHANQFQLDWKVHFFITSHWKNDPKPLDGLSEVKWYAIDSMPYSEMVVDQICWLPMALKHVGLAFAEVEIFYGDPKGTVIEKGNFKLLPLDSSKKFQFNGT
jgi:ADP-ribose pyrophosphatase YjhB (NUDIX family)